MPGRTDRNDADPVDDLGALVAGDERDVVAQTSQALEPLVEDPGIADAMNRRQVADLVLEHDRVRAAGILHQGDPRAVGRRRPRRRLAHSHAPGLRAPRRRWGASRDQRAGAAAERRARDRVARLLISLRAALLSCALADPRAGRHPAVRARHTRVLAAGDEPVSPRTRIRGRHALLGLQPGTPRLPRVPARLTRIAHRPLRWQRRI
jgi:hypothetical protein